MKFKLLENLEIEVTEEQAAELQDLLLMAQVAEDIKTWELTLPELLDVVERRR